MKAKQIEFIGYAAMFFLIVSFMLDNIVYLRIVNSIGAILFIIYGILKKAFPVTLTNVLILMLNLYHLTRHFLS